MERCQEGFEKLDMAIFEVKYLKKSTSVFFVKLGLYFFLYHLD